MDRRAEVRLVAIVGLALVGAGLLVWGSRTGQLQIFGDTVPQPVATSSITVPPRSASPASTIYEETFATPAKKDPARTTADWNSDARNVSLAAGAASGLVQSLTVAAVTGPKVIVTMDDRVALPTGSAINFAISADGGRTWEPMFPGRTVSVTNPAGDWRWRALLERGSASVNPTLTELRLTFAASG